MVNDITVYVVMIVIGGFMMLVYITIQALIQSACGLVKRWWIARRKRAR